jgi:ABC-2 type transport system permease protein
MGLEQVFRLVPKIGADIVGYLPFENLGAFVNGVQLEGIGWDTYGSGAYFLVWAVAAWVAGVVVLQRRDA